MSKLDIWNMALTDAGQEELASLTDPNHPVMVRVLTNAWPNVFRSQLELYDWAFARQDEELEEHDTPVVNDKWIYEYEYPDDALVIRSLHAVGDDEIFPFEVRLGSRETAAKQIFSDLGGAYAVFTRLLDDTSDTEMGLLDAAFVQSVSLLLQSRIIMRVTQDPNRLQVVLKLYERAHSLAARATAAQRYRRDGTLPRAIAARA